VNGTLTQEEQLFIAQFPVVLKAAKLELQKKNKKKGVA